MARALDETGDWWTFLIVRDALRGVSSFEGFQGSLGIARNILAQRLGKLTANGVLAREEDEKDRRRVRYRLTRKGEALAPVLVALMRWGDAWISGEERAPIVLRDRISGEPVAKVALTSTEGRSIRATDLEFTPGPGATDRVGMEIGRTNER